MDLPNIHNVVPQADDAPDVFEAHILAEARQLMRTLRNMTYQLVEDLYFPLMFPYVNEYYQVHGAVPIPENVEEDDDDEIAPPVLVQIPQPEDYEVVVWGPREHPQGPYEPEEDPEEPEEDPEEDPEEFNNPPQNEADWQHLMQMPNPDFPSDDEANYRSLLAPEYTGPTLPHVDDMELYEVPITWEIPPPVAIPEIPPPAQTPAPSIENFEQPFSFTTFGLEADPELEMAILEFSQYYPEPLEEPPVLTMEEVIAQERGQLLQAEIEPEKHYKMWLRELFGCPTLDGVTMWNKPVG
ncbi:hypothetical protein RHMOL_Rhmol02G0197100 [Rhododendron molle]|uniref:Uncharacterized protein n=1 Tax=Rhododendron molle TaxID=49168 RepID=A0ACC0PSF3_RHOML|nr:hypothetical protein RHMOL_Rhmol02G0197100 [Rhododendron molle]